MGAGSLASGHPARWKHILFIYCNHPPAHTPAPPPHLPSHARNDILMPFLWGFGGEEPIRYRVLPVEQYLNIREAYTRAAAWAWGGSRGGGGGACKTTA